MASIINATTTAGVSVQGDNSGSLQLATNNGTTALTIDTSQNVGIGTSSPSSYYKPNVVINNSNSTGLSIIDTSTTLGMIAFGFGSTGTLGGNSNRGKFWYDLANDSFNWNTAGVGSLTPQMRITSSGQLFVNNTTNLTSGALDNVQIGCTTPSSSIQYGMMIGGNATGFTVNAIRFVNTYTPAVVGTITIGSSSTAYNTSSDYRLKENIAPMTGALGIVQQLKPVTYNWKSDGSSGQGFIAHELQAIVPDCVTGEKDAVDEEGNPVHQGVDTSFLVATLTAAIQELKAELDATKAEVQALKGVT